MLIVGVVLKDVGNYIIVAYTRSDALLTGSDKYCLYGRIMHATCTMYVHVLDIQHINTGNWFCKKVNFDPHGIYISKCRYHISYHICQTQDASGIAYIDGLVPPDIVLFHVHVYILSVSYTVFFVWSVSYGLFVCLVYFKCTYYAHYNFHWLCVCIRTCTYMYIYITFTDVAIIDIGFLFYLCNVILIRNTAGPSSRFLLMLSTISPKLQWEDYDATLIFHPLPNRISLTSFESSLLLSFSLDCCLFSLHIE